MEGIETPAVRRGRGRRPAAEVRADILAATAALLYEEGMAAVTFGAVALLHAPLVPAMAVLAPAGILLAALRAR